MSTTAFPSLGKPTWPQRFARAGVWVVGLGVLLALIAGPLNRFGITGFMPALLTLVAGAFFSLLGSLSGIIGLLSATAKRQPIARAATAIAIVAGLAVSGYLLTQVMGAMKVPPIHEISTDLADPPPFVAIKTIRDAIPNLNPSDYVAEQAGRGGRGALNVPDAQRKTYPDVLPIDLSVPSEEAFARAERAVRDLGLEVIAVVPSEGRIEATATTRFFGFKDDVVVRVRSMPPGSRVDIRSKSRVGLGDAGANAARIRALAQRMQSGG
jgi:uncharacterized protein (DUF1499 family)